MKDEKETINLINRRDELRKLREKKAENEEFRKEIGNLNTICFALSGSIKFEREKNESLLKEINFRKKHLEEIEKNFLSFNDRNNPEAKGYIIKMKNDIIMKKLEALLSDKIPEINISNSKNDNANMSEENEFHNLITDHVVVHYLQYQDPYDTEKVKDDRQSFRISSKSNFKSLKKLACQFWDIENENDYVITDESEAMIYNEEMSIDSYLRDYSVMANSFRLISLSTLKVRTKLINTQENKIKEKNKFSHKGAKNENVADLNSAHDGSHHKIREFFNEYPGMKPFTLISDDKIGSEGGNRKVEDAYEQAKNVETSFWMLLMLIIFFFLNIYFIYGQRDVGRNNLKIHYVTHLFDNSQISSYTGLFNYVVTKLGFNLLHDTSGMSAMNLTETNVNLWIKDAEYSFAKEGIKYDDWFVTDIEEESGLKYVEYEPMQKHIETIKNSTVNFVLASSIHIISSRVKQTNCSDNPIVVTNVLSRTETCYEIYYSSETAQKDFAFQDLDQSLINEKSINSFLKELTVFKTSEEAQISLDIESLAGNFDGSGYHLDFPAQENNIFDLMYFFSKMSPNQEEFNKPSKSNTVSAKNNIDTYFFVNRNARSLMFLFTLYFPFEDNWMSCLVSFDFLPTGTISPGRMDFKMFRPNIYISEGLIIADIIRFIIVLVFIALMVWDYIVKGKKDNQVLIDLIFSSKTFLNLAIFLIYTIAFIIKLAYCHNKEEDFFSIDKSFYKDTYSIASFYNQIFYYESLLFAAISLKILTFLRLNDHIKMFFSSIEMGIAIFVKYCIFFVVILLGYACIAHILWGPYISDFGTFGNSFLQILLFTMGYFNPNLLLTYNSAWTVVFITSFFLFVLYFMYAIFISIYAESLRRTVIKIGYPEDHQLSQWTLKEYVVWLCYCIGGNKKKEEQTS